MSAPLQIPVDPLARKIDAVIRRYFPSGAYALQQDLLREIRELLAEMKEAK